jgi:hypothetical protein
MSADPKPCRMCENGEWYSECCNGAGGCSCGGDIVYMGTCHVCGGTGVEPDDADRMANVRSIAGLSYLGSGPRR